MQRAAKALNLSVPIEQAEKMRSEDQQSKSVSLDGYNLDLQTYTKIARERFKVTLEARATENVNQARRLVEEKLASDSSFYGINTGFGALATVCIPKDKLSKLQLNLIRSHAVGVGRPLPEAIVRGLIALRIQTMLRGHSGVRLQTIELMADFLNHNILPVIPSQGSVGASGDLAPLAHLALALIGEGKVTFEGKVTKAKDALERCGLKPLEPGPKEGLSLINGTQVMTATGLGCLKACKDLLIAADIALALTIDALKGTPAAFAESIQRVRSQRFQDVVAANVRSLLDGDPIVASHESCTKVQDPYSLRCAPQVHGAVRHAHEHALGVLLTEANASTDNPLVFVQENAIVSGGNFHGAPIAYVLDYMAIVMCDLGSICERRIEKLVNPHMSGLPPFLTQESGLNSGHMITHVVAAALTNENKVLASPASCDSIPTSAEQEDHVSMGMTSALKLTRITENLAHIVAIELIAAAQGVEFHRPLGPSHQLEVARQFIREYTPFLTEDQSISEDISALAKSLLNGNLTTRMNAAGVELQ
jgi:histidine ammonia-lyase